MYIPIEHNVQKQVDESFIFYTIKGPRNDQRKEWKDTIHMGMPQTCN